jgi:hypothetical protein
LHRSRAAGASLSFLRAGRARQSGVGFAELQIILTTHSPYVLEELPERARMQIFWSEDDRKIMTGVSAQFAMSKMDDAPHPDCEIYVEDEASKTMLGEILSLRSRDLATRIQIYTFGAASVGYQLGQMVGTKRFPRPTAVFLDGDCKAAMGCHIAGARLRT